MLAQGRGGCEGLAAAFTLEGFIPGVDPLVVVQVPLRPEPLGAVRAAEWKIPVVSSHVNLSKGIYVGKLR